MMKVEKSTIVVDGIGVPVYSKEFAAASILEATVGTTGYKGGDSGHGGRTIFRLTNLASTDMRVKVEDDEVTICFGGDAELYTFIDALEFASTILGFEAMHSKGGMD